MGAGLLTTGLQSCWLVVSLSGGLTPSSASVDEAARLRGIMRKFVQGVVEIRSLKLGEGTCAASMEQGVGAGGQGARNAARFGSRLSVLGYQVDKGEQKYRTNGPVMIADSDYANSITALFEMQRRVNRVAFPQGIFFAGEFLGSERQRLFPKAAIRPASHGRSSNLPERRFRELFEDGSQASALSEIGVNLTIPFRVFVLANKGG